jgi:hypothetical protein
LVNYDWNRIQVELDARLAANREHGRPLPADKKGGGSKVSTADADAVLEQIKEALRIDHDSGQ